MSLTRRDLILSGIAGAGSMGLRALATGLPIASLALPSQALANGMPTSGNPGWLASVKDKPYNRVSWLTSHNAFNSYPEIKQGGDSNQHYGIRQQLADGVRAFMIDIHPMAGGLRLQHGGGTNLLSYEDLCDFLSKIKGFLDANRNEIVTLFCESYGDIGNDLQETFAGKGPGTKDFTTYFAHARHGRAPDLRSGDDWWTPQDVWSVSPSWDVSGYLYSYPRLQVRRSRNHWPTIGQLIASNKRLIVFRETDDAKGKSVPGIDSWYHDQWAYTCETPYTNSTYRDLQTNSNVLSKRGFRGSSIFTLYHQPTKNAAGSSGFAETANLDEYLYARCMVAWKLTGKRPSPAVDFYRSINKMPTPFNTLATCNKLNNIKEVYGEILFTGGNPFFDDLIVENVQNTKFSDSQYRLTLSKYDTAEPSQEVKVNSMYSFPLVPGETVSYRLRLAGYKVFPDVIQVNDFSKDHQLDIRVTKL